MEIKDLDIKIVDAKFENLTFDNSFSWQHVNAYQYTFAPFKVLVDPGPHKLILLFAHIEIEASLTNHSPILTADISIAYKLKDAESSLQIRDGRISNKELISFLFETGYSTARGLISNQVKGTTFNSAYLPLIDSQELFSGYKKIVPFELDLVY